MGDKYELVKVNFSAGENNETGTEFHEASVTLKLDGQLVTDAAIGNGMVDAAYKAINRALQIDVKVVGFAVDSIGDGSDAHGQVNVRIDDDGHVHEGVGRKTNIVTAGVYAYLDALNKKARFADSVGVHSV